jgi:hypothetical protein
VSVMVTESARAAGTMASVPATMSANIASLNLLRTDKPPLFCATKRRESVAVDSPKAVEIQEK